MRQAARCAVAAGFDAVELHCGHGYLLSQFLSPLVNRRRDALGGSVARRAAFPLAVLRAVRGAVGDAVPLFVKMNAEDGFWGGLQIDAALETAALFAAAGADAVIPSYGHVCV